MPPDAGPRSRAGLPAVRVAAALLFAAWAAGVWVLSSLPDPRSVLDWRWDTPDLLAHAAEFAVGGLLARAALGAGRGPVSPAAWAVLVCAAWGFVDEVHQGFVPGRSADPLDLAADAAGAAGGVALHGALVAAARRTVRASR